MKKSRRGMGGWSQEHDGVFLGMTSGSSRCTCSLEEDLPPPIPLQYHNHHQYFHLHHHDSLPRSLYRSRSLPQLLPSSPGTPRSRSSSGQHPPPAANNYDSGVGCSGSCSEADQPPGAAAAVRTSRLVAELRQLLTLKQHYYPEGGWGWVIVVCAVLVQCLSHGLHGAAGILYDETLKKFGEETTQPAGKQNVDVVEKFIYALGLNF